MPKPTADLATFLAACKHPLRAELDALRAILAKAAPSLVEGVKWNAPSYRVPDGDDCLTFNLGRKDRVRLIFHRGAKVKDTRGKGRLLADDQGLLEWAADDRAIASFTSLAEVAAAKTKLAKVVKAWVAAVGGCQLIRVARETVEIEAKLLKAVHRGGRIETDEAYWHDKDRRVANIIRRKARKKA